MLISVVVPCFNEEEVLPETLERLFLVTDKIKSNFTEDITNISFYNKAAAGGVITGLTKSVDHMRYLLN